MGAFFVPENIFWVTGKNFGKSNFYSCNNNYLYNQIMAGKNITHNIA